MYESGVIKKQHRPRVSIPYFHETNGRIERVNRTLREMLKKMKGSIANNFYMGIQLYNNKIHRGMGKTPN